MKRFTSKTAFLAGIVMAVFVFSLSLTQLSLAKTTVTKTSNCEFKVTVEIAFAFLDKKSQDKADELIKTWTEAMKKVWNGPNGHQTFGECECKVTFEFVVQKLEKGKDCRNAPAGFHCINVTSQPTNQRGNVADAHEVPPDGSTNGFGEWTIGASGNDAAHEVGHLMGLGEGYRYEDKDGDGNKETFVNTNKQEGVGADGKPKPQGIMSETWGDPVALQSYIDEIMKDAGQECPPECCCGNGKLDGDPPVSEECDPTADPNGCEEDQTCKPKECVCEGGKEPECGDGKINGFEMCDHTATPTGCEQGEKCVDCICFKESELTPPADDTPKLPPPQEEPTTSCGNEICEEGENCTNCPTDCPCADDEICSNGQCMSVACRSDQECDDQDACTFDQCQNPGAPQAECINVQVTSCTNNDGCCPSACNSTVDNDCGAQCGNAICEAGENCQNCPEDCDCLPECGNQQCEQGEDCDNCATDCGDCPAACGDGLCEAGEDCDSCPGDCGACGPECGDGLCDQGEDCGNCESDCGLCPQEQCIDGIDNDQDGLIDFPEDPGCTHPLDMDEYNDPACGNGICEPQYGEEPMTCPADCPL